MINWSKTWMSFRWFCYGLCHGKSSPWSQTPWRLCGNTFSLSTAANPSDYGVPVSTFLDLLDLGKKWLHTCVFFNLVMVFMVEFKRYTWGTCGWYPLTLFKVPEKTIKRSNIRSKVQFWKKGRSGSRCLPCIVPNFQSLVPMVIFDPRWYIINLNS